MSEQTGRAAERPMIELRHVHKWYGAFHVLKDVNLEVGQVLIEADQAIEAVWFPEDAVTSTLQLLSDGNSVEAGLMGLEGVVGIQLWLRANSTQAPPERHSQRCSARRAASSGVSLPVTGPGSTTTGDTDCRAGRVRAQAAQPVS